MSVAFWSEIVTAKKPFETQPPEGYAMNLQNVAVLNVKESVNLFACTDAISGDKIKALIAVLSPKIPQAQLSLAFGYDVPVTFRVEGCSKAEVHISGYYQPIGESDDEDSDGEDDEDFDEEAYVNTLRNSDGSLNEEGKMLIENDMSGSEDNEESDSEDERVDADFIKKMLAKNGGGAPASDSEEDSEEDSDEEEEEESEEEEKPPKKKQAVVSTPSGGGNKSKHHNTPVSKGKPAAPPQQNSNQKKSHHNNNNNNNKQQQKSGEKRKK